MNDTIILYGIVDLLDSSETFDQYFSLGGSHVFATRNQHLTDLPPFTSNPYLGIIRICESLLQSTSDSSQSTAKDAS